MRSYEHDPTSGKVQVEFFPEQPEHEVVVGEQPVERPKLEKRVPGYDQLFNGSFPKFNNGADRG